MDATVMKTKNVAMVSSDYHECNQVSAINVRRNERRISYEIVMRPIEILFSQLAGALVYRGRVQKWFIFTSAAMFSTNKQACVIRQCRDTNSQGPPTFPGRPAITEGVKRGRSSRSSSSWGKTNDKITKEGRGAEASFPGNRSRDWSKELAGFFITLLNFQLQRYLCMQCCCYFRTRCPASCNRDIRSRQRGESHTRSRAFRITIVSRNCWETTIHLLLSHFVLRIFK